MPASNCRLTFAAGCSTAARSSSYPIGRIEYQGQFGVDEHGNWVGGDDTEREAAWAEYYKEYGQPEGAEGASAEAAPEA